MDAESEVGRPGPWSSLEPVMRSQLAASLALAVMGGSLACFPTRPGPRLAHFDATSPAVGEAAPDFALPGVGGGELRLSELLRGRPLVLVLGSESCPVFRHRRHWLRALERRYRGRVDFLAVYTREAHPVGGPSPFTGEEWDLWVNRLAGVRARDASHAAERMGQARRAARRLGLPMPMAVDGLDDAVWRAYGAASAPAFVVDARGRVAARQVWSDPAALYPVLDALLGEASAR